MKSNKLSQTILICALVVGGAVMLSSCGKDDPSTSTTLPTDTTAAQVTTTIATTAAIPAISGSLPVNEVGITPTWAETAIDPAATMYVNVESDFLRVRKGPGQDYDQVASLTDGMSVIVVAKTDTNWYKLQDGYYVSGDYLAATP